MSNQSPIPLAIVGIGCRLPGGATNPEKLWELLANGKSAWSRVPAERFNEEAFLHPDPDDRNGTNNHLGGHFLDQDIAEFDAGFFNVSPQEASSMDPQQRLLLETTYEALESAGIPQEKIRGSNTSVHMAMFTRDYDRNAYKDVADISKYHVTGAGEAIMANRISHLFDLHGPSMTIDTGCSGAMAAVAQACQSLRSGDCDVALAGAANLILSPDHHISMSNLHMLNAEGKTYSFDSRGAGYGRGEGVATLALKRLDDALKAGDPIRAIIRDAVLNQDGHTAGITLPSAEAQAQLERKALARVGLRPQDVAYIEAHGTGTAAGDAAELDAISKVFCSSRDSPLYVGSVKSNIGHLEGVSGLAALIKATMMLEKNAIPPNVNFVQPKEDLRLDERKIKIPTGLYQWPRNEPKRVSVNSFGYGGTNAHAILEGAPERRASKTLENAPQLFIVSARTQSALASAVNNIQSWVSERVEDLNLRNLSYTLTRRRSLMPWRISCVASDRQQLLESLNKVAKTNSATKIPSNVSINFVFTGQGAQWPQMGQELLNVEVFKASIARSRDSLRQLGASWDLVEELLRDTENSRLKDAELSQPVTTAVQIALVDLLHTLGISPTAVVGHSSGEIAAAYAAGLLSHETAIRTAYFRGFSAGIAKAKGMGEGAMLAVGIGETACGDYISRLKNGRATVACQNSPSSTTLSGDSAAISEIAEILTQDSVFNRRLLVNAAYHSHHMQAAATEYETSLGDIRTNLTSSSVRFFSSVIGSEKTQGFDASYWTANLVSKVRFCDAIQALCESQLNSSQPTQTHQVFIEIGPHNALAGPARQSISEMPQEVPYDYCSTLVRGTGGIQTVLDVIGKVIEKGLEVNFEAISSLDPVRERPAVMYDLPSYAWDHSKRYWHESRLSKEYRLRKHPYHDLLGLRMIENNALRPSWRHLIGVAGLPWLRDHVVDGSIIFPGAGYLCMAIEAARQLAGDQDPSKEVDRVILRDISFLKGLVVPDPPSRVEVQLNFSPIKGATDGAYKFVVSAISDSGAWAEHCQGTVLIEPKPPGAVCGVLDIPVTLEEASSVVDSASADPVLSEALYEELRSVGNTYGKMFSGIDRMLMQGPNAVSSVTIPDVASTMPAQHMRPHIIHPTTLDILLHSSLPLVNRLVGRGSVMPVRIDELALSTQMHNETGSLLSAVTTLTSTHLRGADADILVFTNSNGAVMSVSGLELRSLASTAQQDGLSNGRGICHEMKWDMDADHIPTEALRPTKSFPSVKKKWDAIERATEIYIRRCVEAVSKSTATIPDDHRKLQLQWMTEVASKSKTDLDLNNNSEEILKHSSIQGVEGEFLERLGPALPDIVMGNTNPLQLMLEGGLLYRVYADDSSARCYALMSEYLKFKSFKQSFPSVLEIGGGTGGATLPFLQALQENGARPLVFDFTDVSSGFFDNAREKLKDWSSSINFRPLDIEKEPAEQGFTNNSYDIILACNVLHATPSVKSTLSKVRRLLKPGGVLLLIEITKPRKYHNVTFGTLPGWWKGVGEGRKTGPLLPPESWREHMSQVSMEMQHALYDDLETPMSSLMVAKAVEDSEPRHNPVRLIMESDVPKELKLFSDQILSELKDCGLQTHSISWDKANLSSSGSDIHVVIDDGQRPVLNNISSIKFQKIVQLLKAPSKVVWITVQTNYKYATNPVKHLITGVSRTAHAENDDLNMVTVDVQQGISLNNDDAQLIDFLSNLIRTHGMSDSSSTEREYIFQDNQILIPRVIPSNSIQRWMPGHVAEMTKMQPFRSAPVPLRLDHHRTRVTNTPVYVENESMKGPLKCDEIELSLEAMGTSDDVTRPSLNGFVGIVTAVGSSIDEARVGDRVVAFDRTPYPNKLRVPGCQVRSLSNQIPSATVASLLIPFMASYHALSEVASVSSGSTVVVHGAAKAAAKAAIAVAKGIGATVIQAVPRHENLAALNDPLTALADYIVPDSGYSCKYQLRKYLGYRLVDAVISCTEAPISRELSEVVKPFGHFVHIEDHSESSSAWAVPNTNLLSSPTISRLDIDSLMLAKPKTMSVLLSHAVDLFQQLSTVVQATNINVEPIQKMEKLFTSAAQRGGYHSPLLALQGDDSPVRVCTPEERSLILSPDATYLISGGLGDLGKRFIRLMCEAGAQHIVTLSRGVLSSHDGLDALQDQMRKEHNQNCSIQDIQCDIAKLDDVRTALSIIKAQGLPPVRGVIQAAVSLKDSTLNTMTADSFNSVLKAKVQGTLNLNEVFAPEGLSFFICLSSAVTVIGTSGQANYNAGNAVQDALAQFNRERGDCHYMSLNIGTIEGAEATADSQTRVQSLRRQGLTPIMPDELLGFFKYALSSEPRSSGCTQAVIGFTPESLAQTTAANGTAHTPMFTHVREQGRDETQENQSGTKKTIKSMIEEAQDMEEISQLVALAIGEKVANLVAGDASEVQLSTSIADFYLDSLITIELRNWINREFQATISVTEIMNSQDFLSLGTKVTSRSALINGENSTEGSTNGSETRATDADTSLTSMPSSESFVKVEAPRAQLEQLPPPDLDTALDMLVDSRKGICSKAELAETMQAVAEFREAGAELRDALLSKSGGDIRHRYYEEVLHLERREPLQDHAVFYLGHLTENAPSHSQAERAAIITLSALRFKNQLETGILEQNSLNGSPLCMDTLQWLFHASQEPGEHVDRMQKYSASNEIVVMRRGHIFRMTAHHNDGFAALTSLFTEILSQSQEPRPAISVLTSEKRATWARLRREVAAIGSNASNLAAIESAAFVICLDDCAPSNPTERCTALLLNDRHLTNRWLDKTLQFVVTENGVSSLVGLNSTLDGLSAKQLHQAITDEIMGHTRDFVARAKREHEEHQQSTLSHAEELVFETPAHVAHTINQQRLYNLEHYSVIGAFRRHYPGLSRVFLGTHRLRSKGTVLVAIALATRLFYGHFEPVWETVTMAKYARGRTDWLQTVTTDVAEWIEAALEHSNQSSGSSSSSNLLTKLRDAVGKHTQSVRQVADGRGFVEPLYALLSVAEARKQELPALFRTAAWKNSDRNATPKLAKTDCLGSGGWLLMQEAGFLMPRPRSLFIHYEVHHADPLILVQGREEDVAQYEACLDKAVSIIRAIVENGA
ncbi:Lovastatin diketide synthase LovF 12 [Colletotrichum chlorophyti]|uniref:Lovastatin diketide synthase LovF 12 n=1 Tax=Colletotrichum chlorophyti TaxID=708187 RepID=A0A1Q8RJA6_9PEZI|nr:Lovastatin diketide synthase LovF 12 [Colletotrichum chlorophyti]